VDGQLVVDQLYCAGVPKPEDDYLEPIDTPNDVEFEFYDYASSAEVVLSFYLGLCSYS
jgi:hypothetical protein